MAKAYEGTARVRFDAESGRVFLDRGVATSTLTAADADKILSVALEAATKHKAGLDRWSFYVRGENEKLSKTNAKAMLAASTVKTALKAGFKASLVLARYGKPAIWIESPTTSETKAKVSKYQDLA